MVLRAEQLHGVEHEVQRPWRVDEDEVLDRWDGTFGPPVKAVRQGLVAVPHAEVHLLFLPVLDAEVGDVVLLDGEANETAEAEAEGVDASVVLVDVVGEREVAVGAEDDVLDEVAVRAEDNVLDEVGVAGEAVEGGEVGSSNLQSSAGGVEREEVGCVEAGEDELRLGVDAAEAVRCCLFFILDGRPSTISVDADGGGGDEHGRREGVVCTLNREASGQIRTVSAGGQIRARLRAPTGIPMRRLLWHGVGGLGLGGCEGLVVVVGAPNRNLSGQIRVCR